MHTIAIVIVGLCVLLISRSLRRTGSPLLATAHTLGCAGVVAGELMHWPLALRVVIWISVVICSTVGGIQMPKRGLI